MKQVVFSVCVVLLFVAHFVQCAPVAEVDSGEIYNYNSNPLDAKVMQLVGQGRTVADQLTANGKKDDGCSLMKRLECVLEQLRNVQAGRMTNAQNLGSIVQYLVKTMKQIESDIKKFKGVLQNLQK